jgi:hypothetical protein
LETEQKKTSVAVVSIKKAEPFGEKSGLKISMGPPRLLLKLVLFGFDIFCKQTAVNPWESVDYVRM